MRVICVYFGSSADEAKIAGFAETCYTLTPDIALRKREAVFLDVARCGRLYSEKTALARIGAGVKTNEHRRMELPLARLADYVDPFGRDLMADAAVLRMLEALEALGLRPLGDFAKLPVRDLVARAGAPAEIAWRRLRGTESAQAIPWPRWKLPEKIRESAQLQEHERCASLEPLLFKA